MTRSVRGARKPACRRRSLGSMKPDESTDLNSGSVGAGPSQKDPAEQGDQQRAALQRFKLVRAARGSMVAGLAVLLLQWACERGWGPDILAGPIDMTLVFAGTAAFFVMQCMVFASDETWVKLSFALVVAGRSHRFLRDLDPSPVASVDSQDQIFVALHAETLRKLGVVEPELAAHKATLMLMLVREQLWISRASAGFLLAAAAVFAVWSLSRGIRMLQTKSAAAWSAGLASVLQEELRGLCTPAPMAQNNVGQIRTVHAEMAAASWWFGVVVSYALGFGGVYLLLVVGTSWGWLLILVMLVVDHRNRWVVCGCPSCAWAHEAPRFEQWTVCEACGTSFQVLAAESRSTSSAVS